MQAYAHASWSGDNTTTWSTLRRSTSLTLSSGLSFLSGLYGHDIGGFAPSNVSPSPELLLRWVQHGAWHTRFVVHCWKEVETTLWMYDGVIVDGMDIGMAIRKAVRMRYRLAPTFYSLYVTHYHRCGWPVLKVRRLLVFDWLTFLGTSDQAMPVWAQRTADDVVPHSRSRHSYSSRAVHIRDTYSRRPSNSERSKNERRVSSKRCCW